MAYLNTKSYVYYGGGNSHPRANMENSTQHDTNMTFIMDSLKVIRNQLATLRMYLPAIFTFCVLTLFLTIFIHHVKAPSSVFIFNHYSSQAAGSSEQNNAQHVTNKSNQQWNAASHTDRSLVENFNAYASYSELITGADYLHSKQTCEYGSLWQTTSYLQGNITVDSAADDVTRTLNVMGIPSLPYAPNYRSPCFLQNVPGQQTRLRCLPYFFLAGFPKCGTTDMYKRMELHPLIAGANEKEPMWFSRDRVFYKKMGIKTTFTRYSTKFSQPTAETQNKARRVTLTDAEGHPVNNIGYHPLLIGDFSTRVLFDERVTWEENKPMNAHLIRHVMPCTKFIVLMRDPVERLYSDYIYFLKREPKYISAKHFHKRVVEAIKWWEECTAQFPVVKCLTGSPKEVDPVYTGLCFDCWQANKICPNIRIGLYYYILEQWLKLFPRESFLFLRMEDYTGNELDVLNEKVFPFLGLPPLGNKASDAVAKMEIQFPAKNEDVREKFKPTPMLNQTRDLLTSFYRDSNVKLSKLLNDERYLWNS